MISVWQSILLFGHIVFAIVGFGAVIVIDTFGMFWLLKWKGVTIPLINKVARITQLLIWTGWFGLVATGIPLVILKGGVSNLAKIKIFFVFMLGLNGIFLHLIKGSTEKLGENDAVPAIVKFRIGLASTISQLGWWGALIIGFSNRHLPKPAPQPGKWYYVPIVVTLGIAVAALIGEKVLRPKIEKPK